MAIICVRENDDEVIEACPYCHVAGATLNIFRDDRVFYGACANCGACGGRCTSAQNALTSWNQVASAVSDTLLIQLHPELFDLLGRRLT